MSTYTSEEKRESREALIQLYRAKLYPALPPRRQFWSLCNLQPKVGSELAQLVDSGLIKPQQYHGVDRDPEIIAQNRVWWFESNWYCGNWSSGVLSVERFNPGLVFYDSMSTPLSLELYRDVTFLMSRCPAKTMVCVNVMLNDSHPPWGTYDENMFAERLADLLMSDWATWSHDMHFGRYRQEGKRTWMGMYAFVSR